MSKEGQFNKSLDRQLAGGQVAAEGDDAALLAFAVRLSGLQRAPSTEFKSRLKARLMQKLGEQPALYSHLDWLWRLFSRPLVQAAMVLTVILITGAAMWSAGVFSHPSAPVPAVLKAAASTDKTSYNPGEPVLITVSLQNLTSEVLTMTDFPPILSLMSAESNQAAFTFRAGAGTRTIEPAQTASFSLTWNQVSDSGQQAAPGRYYIELEDLYYQGSAVKLTLAEPVEFTLK